MTDFEDQSAPHVDPYEAARAAHLRRPPQKSVFLAAILSICPGLGQVYVGFYRRGFLHIVTVAGIITLLANGSVRGMEAFFGLFLAFFWAYGIVDAARRAALYNRAVRQEGVDESFLLPDESQGRAAGVVLIVVGSILLLHTRFDWDLYWLREWWPAALILLGLSILRSSRKAASRD